MPQAKTILVVDDEEKIADVVKSYLENAGHTVTAAHTGRQALDCFERGAPDLVILDLMLPDMAGEAVCSAIRRKSRVPIIMLTAKTEDASVVRGLDIGADDYVTKPFSPRQLVARVDAVLRRWEGPAAPMAAEFSFDDGGFTVNERSRGVRKHGEPVALTPNEFSILLALVKRPAKVFTRDELITLALGDHFEGYERAIDTHIKNIRQKIEDDPKSPKRIVTVFGVGYRFGGGRDEG